MPVVTVKICGITSLEDALGAAAAGADALGFVFAEGSPRLLSIEAAEAITRRLPPHPMRVGVFVDAPAHFVAMAIQRCGLAMAQFHGAETPEFCAQFGVMAMKAFRVRDNHSLAEMENYAVDAILLDSHVPGAAPGGTGVAFDWTLALKAKNFGKPLFLAGGLTPDNVAQAVRLVQPFGVDVSSGVEKAPGKKDLDKVRRFIAAARAASAEAPKEFSAPLR